MRAKRIRTKIIAHIDRDEKGNITNTIWKNHIIHPENVNGVSENDDGRAIIHYGSSSYVVDMPFETLNKLLNL